MPDSLPGLIIDFGHFTTPIILLILIVFYFPNNSKPEIAGVFN
jgi:hypothetical protein